MYVEFALRKGGLGNDTVPATVVWTAEDLQAESSEGPPTVLGISFLVRQWHLPDRVVAAALEQAQATAEVPGERRVARRLPCEHSVLVRRGRTAEEMAALIVDVSDHGAQIHSKIPLDAGELVHLFFATHAGLMDDSVPSIVRWCQGLLEPHSPLYAHLSNACGLQFVQPQIRLAAKIAQARPPAEEPRR